MLPLLNDLYVDLQLPDGECCQGVIEDFSKTEVEVRLMDDEGISSTTMTVAYSSVYKRTFDILSNVQFEIGSKCEIAIKQPNGSPRWMKATVIELKGPFYKCVKEGCSMQETLYVTSEDIRPYFDSKILEPDDLVRFELQITGEQAKLSENYHLILKKRLMNCKLYVDKTRNVIGCLTTSVSTALKANFLFTFHLDCLDQIVRFMDRRDTLKKDVSAKGELVNALKSGKVFTERFRVDVNLMGLVVGRYNSNLQAARNVKGILYANVNTYTGNILINGTTRESVKEARDLLEYVVMHFAVPRRLTGQLIGRKGETINFIETMTRVNSINKYLLADHKYNTDHTILEITGRRINVLEAGNVIDYFMDHFSERERMSLRCRDAVKKLRRMRQLRQKIKSTSNNSNGSCDDDEE